MSARAAGGPFVADFVEHLARTGTAPVYQTMTHAAVHAGWGDFDPTWHLQRLPLGRVWAYPGYVAFLSTSRLRPGTIPRGGQFLVKVVESLRETTMLDQPLTAGRELSDRLRNVDARLARWLANPNSIVVPTGTIASAVRRRAKAPIGTVQWIEVESAGRRILFSLPTTAGARAAFGAMRAAFGAEWEPRLFGLLAGATR